MKYIINEALKTIPKQSEFYKCISDVIRWHKQYPGDWHAVWFQIQKKWTSEIGCPDGVFSAFDIDAKLNAAYVVLGLLYGNGDYHKTLEIATRAGQDADCNPSTAGGILGTMIGYKKIPAYWKLGLKEAESIDFKYTTLSLQKVYELGFQHAMKMIEKNGGSVDGEIVSIRVRKPEPVKYEKSFEGLIPTQKKNLEAHNGRDITFRFIGAGFVLRGEVVRLNNAPETIVQMEVFIDDIKIETIHLPTDFTRRRHDLYWNYELENREHTVMVKITPFFADYQLRTWDYIVYVRENDSSGKLK